MSLANRNNFIRWFEYGNSLPITTNFNLTQTTSLSLLDVSSNQSNLTGFFMRPDGSSLYVCGLAGSNISQYNLSTPYNLDTAVFFGNGGPIAANPQDLFISPDGENAYVLYFVNSSEFRVDNYPLSTPWDITTIGFVNQRTQTDLGTFSGDFTSLNCLAFNNDGTKFIVGGELTGAGFDPKSSLVLYDVTGTAYNTSDANSGPIDSQVIDDTTEYNSLSPRGLFKPQKADSLFLMDQTNGLVKIDFSDETNIGGAVQSLSLSGYRDVSFSLDGSILYIANEDSVESLNTSIGDVRYGNQKQYDDLTNFSVNFICGDSFSFYANLDTLQNTTSSLRLDLIDVDGDNTFIQGIVPTLTKDIISGSDYRFYADSESIPIGCPVGCFRFAVIQVTTGAALYYSNVFQINSTSAFFTKKIRYRNPIDILNFNYEDLTTFKNEVRIRLVNRNPSYPIDRIGYELIDGSFNPVRSTSGMEYEFITENYNDLDHEAWNAATIQTLEVFNETNGTWETFKRGAEASYEVEWQNNNYPFADGSINLEQVDTYNSSKNV